MQVCLKCDLSYQWETGPWPQVTLTALEQLRGDILTDNKGEAWQCMGKRATMDIMMDNSGFELFAIYILGHFRGFTIFLAE